ncbi:hypothetical protein PUR29_32810 [Methylobacterium ajmalii]|uniref:SMODS and SLOG-associating 2TM effector domain-containing protein n=1 Tax=Methylobacterium ajmalii TaxID=2738439 RepID=A0ABV0A4G0_9HYPH
MIGHILAGSHLSRLDPIDCQNYVFDRGISSADLKEGFSWLQARIEAFNVRSGWVWAERAAKAHRVALQAAALTVVSTPLAAAEAIGCGPAMSDRILGAVSIWTGIVLTIVVLAAAAFRLGQRS